VALAKATLTPHAVGAYAVPAILLYVMGIKLTRVNTTKRSMHFLINRKYKYCPAPNRRNVFTSDCILIPLRLL